MKQSTSVLKSTVILIGLTVLGLCVFALPKAIAAEMSGDFDYGYLFLGLYIPAVPFFYALFQALKILACVDQNKAFSKITVSAFKKIKVCAGLICGLFILGMPYIFYLADRDDAPGVAAIGFMVIGASFIVSVAAALFQKLVQNAVTIKTENDLTV